MVAHVQAIPHLYTMRRESFQYFAIGSKIESKAHLSEFLAIASDAPMNRKYDKSHHVVAINEYFGPSLEILTDLSLDCFQDVVYIEDFLGPYRQSSSAAPAGLSMNHEEDEHGSDK